MSREFHRHEDDQETTHDHDGEDAVHEHWSSEQGHYVHYPVTRRIFMEPR